MRHFLGYKSSGEIISVDSYLPGGWPSSCDMCQGNCKVLEDPDCRLPNAVSMRTKRAKSKPELIGWLAYDCPCSPSVKRCVGCFNDFIAHHYVDVDNKKFVLKPATKMILSGREIKSRSVFDARPVTILKFKVVGDAPDGAVVDVATGGVADITPGENFTKLTFTGGETEELELIAPSHGLKGQCGIFGKYVVPQMFYLRGWDA